MVKKIFCILLFLGLLFSVTSPVYAETLSGGSDWSVTFTADKKMESNFKTTDLDDVISGMQPGDSAVLSMDLNNRNGYATDWYMTNKVLYSLEDRSATAGGGAYTYVLTYRDNGGNETVLYSSDTVGGDKSGAAGEGLHGATNALEEYIFLDTLESGESGTVSLTVALDGETQGNDYQNTLADLQMNYAVESHEGTNETPQPPPGDTGTPGTPGGRGTTVVKTGDETNMVPFIIVAAVSGCLFLFLAILGLRERKQQEGGRRREART